MISAFAIITFAFGISTVMFYYCLKNTCFIRFSIFCVAIFIIAALTGSKYVVFALYLGVSIYVVRSDTRNFVYYYLMLLPVFPLAITWFISLPGIETVFVVNHHRILILAMMMPLLFKLIADGHPLIDGIKTYSGMADRLILVYLLIELVLLFRDNDMLVAARHSLQLILDIWVPYFVISRSSININSALIIFIYTLVALAIVSILEQRLFNRIYDIITLSMGEGYRHVKLRDGELRAYASTGNPLVLGFMYGMGMIAILKIRDIVKCPIYTPWIFSAIVFLGIESTASRSPLLAVFVGCLILVWWLKGRQFVLKTAVFVLPLSIVFIVWFFSGGIDYLLSYDDEGGTFSYRYELILNALPLIENNLFFGSSPDVIFSDPILEQSRQGEGIIDITNSYLFILLKSGIFAVCAYIGIWMVLIRGLYRVPATDTISAILMATCVVTMIMLFISSSVSFISTYSWLLMALVCNYIRYWQSVR